MRVFSLLTILGCVSLLLSQGFAEVDVGPSRMSLKERMAFFEKTGASSSSSTTEKPGQYQPIKRGVAVAEKARAFEGAVKEAPAAAKAVPTNQIKGITKECEEKARHDEFAHVKGVCEAARKAPSSLDFKNFYRSYERNFTKLKELRGFTKLAENALCDAFAKQLSTVHPANNRPFEAAMRCVAVKRGVYEPGAH